MPVDPPLGYVPRQARGLDARRRLYEAALQHFRQDGFEAARIEDVVRDAGVSWGTFFRYFPRKQDVLLHAAADHFAHHVTPAVEAGLAAGDRPARDLMLDLFRSLLEPVEHPPRLHGEIVREVVDHRDRFAAMVGGTMPLISHVTRLLAYGRERGEVRDDRDDRLLAAVLTSGTIFTVLLGYYEPLGRGAPADGLPPVSVLIPAGFGVAWEGVAEQPR